MSFLRLFLSCYLFQIWNNEDGHELHILHNIGFIVNILSRYTDRRTLLLAVCLCFFLFGIKACTGFPTAGTWLTFDYWCGTMFWDLLVMCHALRVGVFCLSVCYCCLFQVLVIRCQKKTCFTVLQLFIILFIQESFWKIRLSITLVWAQIYLLLFRTFNIFRSAQLILRNNLLLKILLEVILKAYCLITYWRSWPLGVSTVFCLSFYPCQYK